MMLHSTAPVVESMAATGLRTPHSRPAARHLDHTVLFYESEDFLSASVADFLAAGLAGGQAAIVIASESHRNAFARQLRSRGLVLAKDRESGRLTMLDAKDVLATIMVGPAIDALRFRRVVGGLIDRGLRASTAGVVRVFGEMVDVLWTEGAAEESLRLEQLWNELADAHPFSLLCAYPMGRFSREAHSVQFSEICQHHADVIPTEQYSQADDVARRVEISVLQQRARALETEVGIRKELEQRLCDVLAERQRADEAHRDSEQRLRGALEAEQRARANAEAASVAKDRVLAALSHELRTPLNAIAGYSELLEVGIGGPITEDQRDYLARIRLSQQYLRSLINNVLDFAKLEARGMHFDLRPVPVDGALSDLEPLVAPQIATKGLVYSCAPVDPAWQVHADADRLRQVMLNLLGNAIKYTDPDGRIEVWASAGEDGPVAPGTLSIHVRDTGVGIPPDRLGTIFDAFVQLRNGLGRPQEGVGLGLAISRELARGMGGDIRVQSAVASGSTFTLILPRASAG
jgi:signal transduction histidine kinase